jgi:hypothetical protein
MGILNGLRGMRDRRRDPDCPLNIAEARVRSIYGPGPKMSVMVTREPNHPVCRKCTRRDWWNCGIMTAPVPTPEVKPTERKEEKEKKEEAALEGLRTLFE